MTHGKSDISPRNHYKMRLQRNGRKQEREQGTPVEKRKVEKREEKRDQPSRLRFQERKAASVSYKELAPENISRHLEQVEAAELWLVQRNRQIENGQRDEIMKEVRMLVGLIQEVKDDQNQSYQKIMNEKQRLAWLDKNRVRFQQRGIEMPNEEELKDERALQQFLFDWYKYSSSILIDNKDYREIGSVALGRTTFQEGFEKVRDRFHVAQWKIQSNKGYWNTADITAEEVNMAQDAYFTELAGMTERNDPTADGLRDLNEQSKKMVRLEKRLADSRKTPGRIADQRLLGALAELEGDRPDPAQVRKKLVEQGFLASAGGAIPVSAYLLRDLSGMGIALIAPPPLQKVLLQLGDDIRDPTRVREKLVEQGFLTQKEDRTTPSELLSALAELGIKGV